MSIVIGLPALTTLFVLLGRWVRGDRFMARPGQLPSDVVLRDLGLRR